MLLLAKSLPLLKCKRLELIDSWSYGFMNLWHCRTVALWSYGTKTIGTPTQWASLFATLPSNISAKRDRPRRPTKSILT